MNMFDVFAVFNDPKFKALIDDLPGYADQWKRLVSSVRRIEAMCEVLDNKMNLLITETAVTPDIHAGAMEMASADPRNGEIKPAWVSADGRTRRVFP